MKVEFLVARRDVPDRRGAFWDVEGLAEKMREQLGMVVTRGFDPGLPAGRLVDVDLRDDGLYATVEITAPQLLTKALRVAPATIGLEPVDEENALRNALDDFSHQHLDCLSLLPPDLSLWP